MKHMGINKLIWLFLLLPMLASAKDFKEGVDYTRLPTSVATNSGDKIEVLEFFWYGCPHCFQFDPYIKNWLKTKPANVYFEHVPAPLNPNWMPHTKAFYTLEIMGKGDQYHQALFEAMHVKKKKIFTQDAIADYLAELGIDKNAFNSNFNSFAVEMRARKAMQLGSAYKLNGVPMITVNGKYVISASQAGGYKEMLAVLDHLIKLEAKAAN